MAEPIKRVRTRTEAQLQELSAALESGTFVQLRRMLNGLPAVDVARLLESSPPNLRDLLWELIDKEKEGEVLQHLSDELQGLFLRRMDAEAVASVAEGFDTDDLADLLQQLPERVIREVLNAMDAQDRHRVERVLAYPEDSAGGLMNTDTITVRPRFTLDVVFRYLRRHETLPAMTDNIIVVNSEDRFIGLLPLTKMLVSDPSITVREIMVTDVAAIPATTSASTVAKLFERHDWVSAPVIDETGHLLGRITIDDVVDVIIEAADQRVMSMGGLGEEDSTFSAPLKAASRRATWLGANLLTGFIAAGVVGLFTETIHQVVALAVLMPIIPSMGGVAGSQTLTLMIRGMALGHVGRANSLWLLRQEMIVGLLNGLLWASIVGVAVAWWFDDRLLGLILAVAMVCNLLAAALTGVLLPLGLRVLGIDPILAGSVLLTTVTDVVGFAVLLGLASWLLVP